MKPSPRDALTRVSRLFIMSMRLRSLLVLGALAAVPAVQAADPTPEQLAFFEGKIRPILSEKCYRCHSVEQNLRKKATEIDQPAAALIMDLKKRGLLDDTLIIWGGEFGRTVTRDRGGNANPGRDHNGRGFCTWLAGGGVKGGTTYGATDEFGARAAENRVHIHDLHATIMQLMGFDHTRLTYRYNGRDFRLTDNFGNVVHDVIA